MKIRIPATSERSSRFQIGRRLFLAGLLISTAPGCKNFVQRSQSPDNFTLPLHDDKKKKTESGYIGDVCKINGLDYAKVEGIGLAVDLRETGSNPKPCEQRDFLVQQLESKRQDISIEPLLAGKDTELVFLKGLLPPGIRKGEKFDIKIDAMANTEAVSLENGMITQTQMRPMEQLGRSVKLGHVNAIGKGRILVESLFETRQDQPNRLRGYILGGGVALEDRTLGLTLGKDYKSAKTTTMIARAINARFTIVDKNGRRGVAEPKTDRYVELAVPDDYRHNIGRYLQVVINTVHSENAAQRLERMEQLEKEMLNPTQAALAAVRLEALGNDGIPILKRALRHSDLEVKFEAAQALAYMGETDGVDHLRFVAETEPAFRWHALTALASLDQRESGAALQQLMHVKSAETRYGAFRAMLARAPQDPIMNGKWLGDFYLHRIASDTDNPMLHFSRQKRPEIVIFGKNQFVSDDFLYVESRMTIRATGNQTVSITRYSTEHGEERKTCSNQVGDLVETLATAGMGYGDLLKMFRTSKDQGRLSSRLVVNAVPRLGRSYVPGESPGEPAPEESQHYINDEILPGLFNDGTGVETETNSVVKTAKAGHSIPAKQPLTPKKLEQDQPKPSTFVRMKGWFTQDK